jgi:hypothetical protein
MTYSTPRVHREGVLDFLGVPAGTTNGGYVYFNGGFPASTNFLLKASLLALARAGWTK